jgi:REP element-mobilizing transposase RayT
MARPLRIQFPGALYHVTSRGNARAPIFEEDSDRRLLLHILGEVVESYRWVCHAFCLMTNHYHLLVETPEANLSRGMRQLNGLYTQRFNRAHERVGHILQGRYGAVLVERDAHLLEVARYVVLNPVRAGLVDAAEAYPWSSLRATLGITPAPAWLTTRALLARFGSRLRYLEFVREGVGKPSPWGSLRGAVLGSTAFVERLAAPIGDRAAVTEFPRPERLVHREPIESVFPRALAANLPLRNQLIESLVSSGRYTAGEVARHLGLHYSTISRIRARARGAPPDVAPGGQVPAGATSTYGSSPELAAAVTTSGFENHARWPVARSKFKT